MIWADRIEGPWSAPIDLKIDGCIDPGHVVGEDGRRYLFTDGIRKIRLSDDWSFHQPAADEAARARYGDRRLLLTGRGTSPADSPPLTCIVGDRSTEAELSFDLVGDAEAGLLLFYNHKAFVGLGFTPDTLKLFEYSEELSWARKPLNGRSLRLRLRNEKNVVTLFYSQDEGRNWARHDSRMEVSGMHHNVFGGFLSLRLGIYAAGNGEVVLRDFRYQGNPSPTVESRIPSRG